MNIGMLWFDNDPAHDLKEKVSLAADFYRGKYGREANLCFVNPKDLPGGETTVGEVKVKATKSVLPNHLWVGVEA